VRSRCARPKFKIFTDGAIGPRSDAVNVLSLSELNTGREHGAVHDRPTAFICRDLCQRRRHQRYVSLACLLLRARGKEGGYLLSGSAIQPLKVGVFETQNPANFVVCSTARALQIAPSFGGCLHEDTILYFRVNWPPATQVP